ncbi:hypothetical protein P7C70_g4767, partial [Phenoliferia sp. Uapishka_3]
MGATRGRDQDDGDYAYQRQTGDYKSAVAAGGGSSKKGAASAAQKASLPRGSACLVCRKRKRLLESELAAYRAVGPPLPGSSRSDPGRAPPHSADSFSIPPPHLTRSPEPPLFVNSHVAPPFVYGPVPPGQGPPGSDGDHLASPLLEQHRHYGSAHPYGGVSPQDSDAGFPLSASGDPSFPTSSHLQSFSFAPSDPHIISSISDPNQHGYEVGPHQHHSSLDQQRNTLPHLRTNLEMRHPAPSSSYSSSPSLQHHGPPPIAGQYSVDHSPRRIAADGGWQGTDESSSRVANSWAQDLPSLDLLLELYVPTFALLHEASWCGAIPSDSGSGREGVADHSLTLPTVGSPVGGPFGTEYASSQMDDISKVLEMDRQLDMVRDRLNALATVRHGKANVNGPILMVLILLNWFAVPNSFPPSNSITDDAFCISQPLRQPPPPPSGIGPEYSMKRCLQGIHSTYEIVAQLAVYENMRTSPYLPRVTTFTAFIPSVNRSRTEDISGRVQRGTSGQDAMPSGDDVFGPKLDTDRLNLVDTLCDAMDRVGVVWDVGAKFGAMVRGDRHKLAERALSRQRYHSPNNSPLHSHSHEHEQHSPQRHSQATGGSHGGYQQ